MPARLAALVLTILVAAPATAFAGDVTGTDGEYRYVDTAGTETNRVVVTRSVNDTVLHRLRGRRRQELRVRPDEPHGRHVHGVEHHA